MYKVGMNWFFVARSNYISKKISHKLVEIFYLVNIKIVPKHYLLIFFRGAPHTLIKI
jgi:hypothetical protein